MHHEVQQPAGAAEAAVLHHQHGEWSVTVAVSRWHVHDHLSRRRGPVAASGAAVEDGATILRHVDRKAPSCIATLVSHCRIHCVDRPYNPLLTCSCAYAGEKHAHSRCPAPIQAYKILPGMYLLLLELGNGKEDPTTRTYSIAHRPSNDSWPCSSRSRAQANQIWRPSAARAVLRHWCRRRI